VFRRFQRWTQRGIFKRIFEAEANDPDLIDGFTSNALMGDKAFDADYLRQTLHEREALAITPKTIGNTHLT
jgi:transposase